MKQLFSVLDREFSLIEAQSVHGDCAAVIRSIIPVRPNDPFVDEIIKQFAPRIQAHRGRRLLEIGINAYVEFLWDSKGCPVFLDPEEDGDAATAFLNFLDKLDIADKYIRFGSFDCKGSASQAEWKTILGLRRRRSFEPWDVPFKDGTSMRPWLGIKPTFAVETPLQSPSLFGFRFLMVMTYIVLQADRITQCQS